MTTNPPITANPFQAMAEQLTPKKAISYIRVSTREQAERGGTQEGFSIPAQREANKRKAATIGALITKEFVDRGESARSANRPELQRMLHYITEHPDIDYVIVHKLDRLARNRADDVDINRALEQANIRLISTTENIDQTPGGILLHGIMSSIAEFYSRNLANEVIKGMHQKAKNGGTIGKAPLGYLNKRILNQQGREASHVELDPERAPLMADAFALYATGDWTAAKLAAHLTQRGLTTRGTRSHPSAPLNKNVLLGLLRNPYYKGIVTYQGVQYQGQHQPLADQETWERVQTVLDQNRNGERTRVHNNHLKGTLRCGQCGSRLIVQNTKSRNGDIYPYFVCIGRQRNHDSCHFKAILIEETDQRITDIYKTIRIDQPTRDEVQQHLTLLLDQIYSHQKQQLTELGSTKKRLQAEQAKLLQAHYADAIPLNILKQEQTRISGQLASIDHEIRTLRADKTKVQDHLDFALNLLQDCHHLYTTSPDHLKKLLNNVFFEKILINPQDDIDPTNLNRTLTPDYMPPFDNLIPITQQKTSEDHSSEAQYSHFADIVSSKTFVVGDSRLELLTSSV